MPYSDPLILSLLGFIALCAIFLAIHVIARKIILSRSLSIVFLKVLLARKDSDSDEKRETVRDAKEWSGIMEQLLTSLRSISKGGIKEKLFGSENISLEFLAEKQEIFFYISVPRRIRNLVEKQIAGFYPDALIEEMPEFDIFTGKNALSLGEMKLQKHPAIPVRTYTKLETDPMNTILGSLAKLSEDESAVVQILLRPVADSWQGKYRKIADKIAKNKGKDKGIFDKIIDMFAIVFEMSKKDDKKPEAGKENDTEEFIREKAKKTGFETSIRIITTGVDQESVENELLGISAAFMQYGGPGCNSFKLSRDADREGFFQHYLLRSFPFSLFSRKKTILSTEEIASIFHFPHAKYHKTPEIRWQNFKIVKAPTLVPTSGILLGTNVYRGVKKDIYLANEDRFRHFYVIGQTGTGKSSILQVMARQDVRAGNGLCVIDPHGDLANDLMPFVPRSRADDIIYFDPADTDRPMGINLLEATTYDEKQTVAQDSMNIMIKLFGSEIFGPRIQDYFRNGVLTLMDYPGGAAITDIVRLFTDDEFQKERRRTLKDPVVRAWWDYTYAKMGDREKGEIIPYFQAKFGGFITNALMRNIIGQIKSSFDIYDIMQNKKILFVNLSKGILGDFNSKLLGLIMVSKIQIAAMRRQLIDKEDRQDFFLYIDEFQNYITDSIESILSEARKYRLGLIVAHQYLGQLHKSDALTKSDVNLKDAIFGNVGSLMSYRIGPEDAEFLEKQFSPQFAGHDLINMDKFKGVMKLHVDGQTTTPFSIIPTNPYLEKGDKKLAKAYKELSRLKYGREREFVEKEIIYRIGAV